MQAQIYEQMNAIEGEHWWFRARRLYLNRLIGQLNFKSDDLRFCEIGSGTGGNLGMLVEHANVDAVEMDEAAREWIKKKSVNGVNRIFGGFLPNDMTHEDTYDAVFALDVIEHVEDHLEALVKIKDYLREDSWFITTVPAYQWLWSKHDEVNHHHRRYNKSEYCKLLESAGYEVNYASYFNTMLLPLAIVERTLSTLLKSENTGELKMPNGILNRLFYKIFSAESSWAGRLSMPFGLSIVVVARKL